MYQLRQLHNKPLILLNLQWGIDFSLQKEDGGSTPAESFEYHCLFHRERDDGAARDVPATCGRVCASVLVA
jgi:hypothetical protein